MPNGTSLHDLYGIYDNLDEPPPLFADPRVASAVLISFLIFSYMCIAFRLYTRFGILKKPGVDDFILIMFLVPGASGTIIMIYAMRFGWGQHIGTINAADKAKFRECFYYANGSYALSTALIKLSLLCQYIRLFERGSLLRRLTVAAIVVISCWGAVFTILAFYPCTRPAMFWQPRSPDHKCWAYASDNLSDYVATYASQSASNTIFDVVVLCLPLPLLWRAGTSTRTRRGLLALFTMGAFVSGIATWRLYSMLEHRMGTYPTLDPFWYAPTIIVLSCVEMHLASVVASVPVFWPVLARHFSRLVVHVTSETIVATRNRTSLLDEAVGGGDGSGPETTSTPDERGGSSSSRGRGGGGGGNLMVPADPLPWERGSQRWDKDSPVPTAWSVQAGGGGSGSPQAKRCHVGPRRMVAVGTPAGGGGGGGDGRKGDQLSRSVSSLGEGSDHIEAWPGSLPPPRFPPLMRSPTASGRSKVVAAPHCTGGDVDHTALLSPTSLGDCFGTWPALPPKVSLPGPRSAEARSQYSRSRTSSATSRASDDIHLTSLMSPTATPGADDLWAASTVSRHKTFCSQ